MRKIVLLLALTALAVLLASKGAYAQQGPLPDLTVEKTGPESATLGDNGMVEIAHKITVTNIGDAAAVSEYSNDLLRDEMQIRGRFISAGGGCCLRVGISGHISGSNTIITHNPPAETFYVAGTNILELYSGSAGTPAVISPSGYVTATSTVTMISGGKVTNCATADPDNKIVESDETNNTDCFTTMVTG